MRLYKIIDIDLDTERARIKRVDYLAKERRYLLRVLDLFEAGEFKKAVLYINKNPKEYREYISTAIFDILWTSCIGDFYVTEAQIKNAKKG